jgi:glucosamine-6-phosphate deaminase
MRIDIAPTKQELGRRAAMAGGELIRAALAQRGTASVILATGASQFEMLGELVKQPIDWSQVTCFHLDEYVGMPMSHPASFRKYLKERFVDQLGKPPAAFHFLDAERDPKSECQRLGAVIRKYPIDVECQRLGAVIKKHPIDVAFIGIGENGHLAFNDPPADFETREPYITVELDDACRQQQFGEGWFPTFDAVPKQAISMSIRQILASQAIICSVPDARKAEAVGKAVEGPLTPQLPASILRNHGATTLFLDEPAAAKLTWRP